MGPLNGLKIIEMAGIGPGPFCGMILADLGAEVIRVDRASAAGTGSRQEPANRGKKSIAVDLKSEQGVEVVLKLIESADAVFEGFRPGVMERLGLGPDVCQKRNEKIVYGRMTGWGQTGPLANAAGHDINYISISGALAAIGRTDSPPVPPLNLIGDFGGGGMLLALGVVAALLETKTSGKGQVIDAAMTDGSSLLMTMMYSMHQSGFWNLERQTNLLDGAAHFYDTYECKDGKFVSIGSIEPQFYALLCEKAGLSQDDFGDQMKRDTWNEKKELIKKVFITKTRDEWSELMEGTDVCFAPVLDMSEAPKHPHNVARKTFIELEGITQPAPAPRFDRTINEITLPPALAGEHSKEIFETLDLNLDLFSSAMKINSQYMHILYFHLTVNKKTTIEEVIKRLEENDRIAITEKINSNEVFSFGRDYGHYGRILNQAVVAKSTLAVRNENEIMGYCFTPQDGNSLLSSLAITEWFLYPNSYEDKIQCLKPLFFDEV